METVSQVMKTNVVTIRPEMTIREAITLLIEHDVSGAPVTDEQGTVLGVLSELALFDVLFDRTIEQMLVREFMTSTVHMVSENEPLTEAAHQFALYGVRRLPVVREGKLVGIVTRRDLLQYCHKQGKQLSATSGLPQQYAEGMAGLQEEASCGE